MSLLSVEIAKQAFARILAALPHLIAERQPNEQIELQVELPVQPGLKHHVWLALQNNDELHFRVGHFWLEWFPCTDAAKVESYVAAVQGFLSGRYRVLESERNGRCFKSELQAPVLHGWETIGTWSRVRLPSFSRISFNVIQNI